VSGVRGVHTALCTCMCARNLSVVKLSTIGHAA
jgi:hypothetical protein